MLMKLSLIVLFIFSRSSAFIVEPKSGKVIVNEVPLTEGRHALFIEASDLPANPSERRYSLAVVTVEVNRPGKGR